MNRILLIIVILILCSCENVHNIILSNETSDTLNVRVWPPISEWTYTLNALNGIITYETDIVNGDTVLIYDETGKFKDFTIYPNSEFFLESKEGLPLTLDNMAITKLVIKNQRNGNKTKFNNKEKILKNCKLFKAESDFSETIYKIKIE